MNTLEFIRYKKKQKCKKQQPKQGDGRFHQQMGAILGKKQDLRSKMDVAKPLATQAPPELLGFIF